MKKTLLLACLAAAFALPASGAGAYRVQFLANGGTGTMSAQKIAYGKASPLAANAFKRSGYVFAGWSKKKTGSIAYKNKQKVKNLAKAGKTVKLYAVWAKKKYKVVFKANGGKGTMTAQAFVYGKAKKLKANAFKRSGYTFAGWAKKAKGKKAYANKQSIKNLTRKGGTVELYAVWAGRKATYRFNANGGTGTMADQVFTVGTPKALRANAFKKQGSIFLGWAKSASGLVKYTDKKTISTPVSTGGKTVTLYAIWTGDQILVSGGTNAGKNPDASLGSYSLTTPSFLMDRTEVTWALWKKVRDWGVAHGYAFENDGMGKGDDHPVCSVNWYDCVKWCNARSEMEGLAPAYLTNGDVYRKGRHVPAAALGGPGYRLPTGVEWEYAARGGRTGSRFPWGDAINQTMANYTGSTATYDTSEGPHGVYATGDYPYTAPVGSFEANGFGLVDMAGNVSEWTWDVVTPGRGVRGGGFDTSDCRCGFVNYHEQGKIRASLGFRTVRCPAYQLQFDANGGTGTMAPRTKLAPGADVVLPANGFSRKDWKFIGWSADPDATTATWKSGATVQGGFAPRSGTTVTLYAVWGRNSYTVRFAANGGSGSMTAQTIPIGVSTALSPNAFAKKDCSFAGWALSSSGPATYGDGRAVLNLSTADGATVTLYAQWKKELYWIKFDSNGASGSMEPLHAHFGVDQTLSPNRYEKEDWRFVGWATNATGAAVYADGARIDAKLEAMAPDGGSTVFLYAVWKRDAYEVRFDPGGATFYPNGEDCTNSPAAMGAMNPQKMRFDNPANLADNEFVKVGWCFAGWATNATGEAVWADGQSVTNLVAPDKDSITLYATWFGGMARIEKEAVAGYGPFDYPFFMDTTEVTLANWNAVRDWAEEKGYVFSTGAGGGKGSTHPVHSVTWNDCLVWCNARSEMEGLDPVYTKLSGDLYKESDNSLPSNLLRDFSKNGYRLPSSTEWMLAACGGSDEYDYPWGSNQIDSSRANYKGHPVWGQGTAPHTAPVGTFGPTGATTPAQCLCDIIGNVAEWTDPESLDNDPATGGNEPPTVGGGGWNNEGSECKVYPTRTPHSASGSDIGFRTVRTILE